MRRLQALLPWLILAAVLSMGSYANYMVLTAKAKPKVPWRPIGSITASQATPAVTARGYAAMTALTDAKTVQWLTVPDDVSSAEFRFSTTADSDSDVVEVWVAANDYMSSGRADSFTLAAILTLTGGTQTGPYSNVFVDTIVAADYGVVGSIVYDSAANRMCRWKVNLSGWKKVLMIATTLQADTTLYVDARW